MFSMRVLIVDPNLVYAKKVKEILEGYVKGCKADLAPNVFVTKRRLIQNHYDLVIVDVLTVMCQEMLFEELKKADIPTIAWMAIHPEEGFRKFIGSLGGSLVQKPSKDEDLRKTLSFAVESATGTKILT